MKKISDLTNEEKLDLLAEIYEPYSTIFSDKEVTQALSESLKSGIKMIVKKYKKEAIQIMAIIDGAKVDENGTPEEGYVVPILGLPMRLTELISDGRMQDFFD